jgi:Cdc6-like AAA superfamily ATPase
MNDGDLRTAQSILKDAIFIAGYDLCKKVTKMHIEAVLKERADAKAKYFALLEELKKE